MNPKKAPRNSIRYTLKIKVLSCESLAAKDKNGLSDPYIKISIGGNHWCDLQKTKIVHKSLNPTYNQEFTFYPQYEHGVILFSVWDSDFFSADDFLGCAMYKISNLFDIDKKTEKIICKKEYVKATANLRKLKIFELIDETVTGKITFEAKLEKIFTEDDKELLCFYNFNDPFDANSKFKTAKLKDVSGKGHHGSFKNLETDNVVQTLGIKCGSYAGKFSGFNYIEAKGNPLYCVSQWSISIFFKTAHPEQDNVLLSCMTTHPTDIKLDKNVLRHAHHLNEYGATQSASQLLEKDGAPKVVLSKCFKAGFLISTTKNEFFDNFGNPIMINSDYFARDQIFSTEHIQKNFLKKKGKKRKFGILRKSSSLGNYDDDDDDRSNYFKADKWNHLVITYDGSRLKEYINSILTENVLCNFQFLGFGGNLQIGGFNEETEFRGIKGSIDNIRIYNYPLNASEVDKLYGERKD